MVTEVRLGQYQKEPCLIKLTLLGMVTEVSSILLLKAHSAMDVTL